MVGEEETGIRQMSMSLILLQEPVQRNTAVAHRFITNMRGKLMQTSISRTEIINQSPTQYKMTRDACHFPMIKLQLTNSYSQRHHGQVCAEQSREEDWGLEKIPRLQGREATVAAAASVVKRERAAVARRRR